MGLTDINSDDLTTRLHGFARLLATPLFVPLEAGQGPEDAPKPALFQTDDGALVLGFLSAASLAAFSKTHLEYALLSGAELVAAMSAHRLGLGLGFGAADAVQLPPDSVRWLAENAATLPPAAPFEPPMDAEPEEGDDVPAILRNLRPYH